MKLIGLLVGFVLVGLGLVGCTSQPEPPPNPVVTVTAEAPPPVQEVAPPPPVEPPTMEQIYLLAVHTAYTDNIPYTDAQLVAVAQATCADLRNGSTFEDITYVLLNSDIDPTLGGTMIGAGVSAFCPEYMNDLETYIATAR